MKQIATLTPPEVSEQYLKANHNLRKVRRDFNLFRISALRNFIKIPSIPFRNTSHGFIILQTGGIEMQLNQEEHVLKAGSILFTPAGQMNSFTKVERFSEGFMGTFDDIFLFQNRKTTELPEVQLMLSPEQIPHFYPEQELFGFIIQICNRMHQINLNHHIHSSFLLQHYLFNILLELLPLFRSHSFNNKSKSQQLVIAFKKILLQNNPNYPKPNEIAASLSVSTNHLNKTLKRHTKFTTTQWINRFKVSEAKYQLFYSNNTIAEIAYHLGFAEPTHFSAFIKKHTDYPPSYFQND